MLVHQTWMVWTKRKLNGDIIPIKKTSMNNDDSENVLNSQVAEKIAQFSSFDWFNSKKCPLYCEFRRLEILCRPRKSCQTSGGKVL